MLQSPAVLERVFNNRSLIRKIQENSQRRHLPSGSIVYTEGQPCRGVGLVVYGTVRVFKVGQSGREITLYEVTPGQACILNAFCVLTGKDYPANAETIDDTEMLIIPSTQFKRVFEGYEEFRQYIYGLFSDRLLAVMELIEEVAFGRMDKRLLEYIKHKAVDGVLMKTHQEIANDLGTSREVVSRLLKDFERRGLLKLSRGTIRVL